jgi:hypothetical protein
MRAADAEYKKQFGVSINSEGIDDITRRNFLFNNYSILAGEQTRKKIDGIMATEVISANGTVKGNPRFSARGKFQQRCLSYGNPYRRNRSL